MLRDRALSAAVLVPPLVLVLVLGGPFIVGLLTVVAAFAAYEVFRLLRSAGFPSQAWFGAVLAAIVVLDSGIRAVPEGSGLLLVAVRIVLAAVGSFVRTDARDGLVTWMTTVFGALRRSARLRRPARHRGAAAARGRAARSPRRGAGWMLLLVLGVWSVRHRRVLHRQAVRDDEVPHPHLTVQDACRADRRPGRRDARRRPAALGLGEPPVTAVVLGPLLGLAAQAGDLAESMLKRAAGARTRAR